MRRYTVRQSFTVPAGVKAELKAQAAAQGMSLSAYMRNVIDDLIIERELAEIEALGGAATA